MSDTPYEIEVGEESEGPARWTYAVRVFGGGRTNEYTVTLSFQDYDHWSHGRVPPSRVVEAAFEFLLDHEPAAAILSRFDCSVIRRYFPAVDEELPGRLAPPAGT
ncbi:MAG: hypothetical protein AAF797_09565 [Planctomycetota bacterium]